jgi:DNA-binding SARP family transcriptional activator
VSPTFTLRLLGGFALEGAHGTPAVRLPQRRGEALLAMLAVAGDLGCTRDRIVALLWPESDEAHARHNLRDALHSIRVGLGHDAVLSSGDTLRLDASVVTCDVEQFAAALAGSHLSAAVAIYRGPLLDGFHVLDAPEFERWVDAERARLFRDCQGAIKLLAKTAEREEHWDEAAEWWGRAVSLDRYNSRFVARRIVALARGGDRANAIKEGEAHCRELKSELELDPEAAFLEELERIRCGTWQVRYFTPQALVIPPAAPGPARPDKP